MSNSRTFLAFVPASDSRKRGRRAGGGFFSALLLWMSVSSGASPALAGPILPGAVSYEYFGFNFAENIATSTTVGTLTYSGGPGCGGTCIATTQLGSDPSVSLNVNEVVYENTGGGGAISELGYYVEYMNTPGTYTVKIETPESLSIADGASGAFAFLAFGPADGEAGTFNPFNSYTLDEADCVNNGCGYIPVAGVTPAPFVTDHFVQMVANTPYFVLLDEEIEPSTTGQQLMAFIDPQFSTTATGGSFDYSSGVTDPSPEPAALILMLSGAALLGGLARHGRRRQQLR